MAKTRGTGLLMVWTDIDTGARGGVQPWYDEEHINRLLRIPGVLSAGRYVAVRGGPKYLALYELEDHHVMQSAAFLDEVRYQPSPQRQRVSGGTIGHNYILNGYRQIFPTRTNPVGSDDGPVAGVADGPDRRARPLRRGVQRLVQYRVYPAVSASARRARARAASPRSRGSRNTLPSTSSLTPACPIRRNGTARAPRTPGATGSGRSCVTTRAPPASTGASSRADTARAIARRAERGAWRRGARGILEKSRIRPIGPVIACIAEQSPAVVCPRGGDCGVAVLLAMTAGRCDRAIRLAFIAAAGDIASNAAKCRIGALSDPAWHHGISSRKVQPAAARGDVW